MKAKQERLLEFINDKKNIEKAIEGSMEKRIKLLTNKFIKKYEQALKNLAKK